ncbi:hypothetical protein BX666DRAFT_1954857 [Dichotomocladium elegans]|nr:hypothetical protein BX666DRAFT_1954857 [Dichotomocladium elegans]
MYVSRQRCCDIYHGVLYLMLGCLPCLTSSLDWRTCAAVRCGRSFYVLTGPAMQYTARGISTHCNAQVSSL